MIDALLEGRLKDFKDKDELRKAIISAGGTVLIAHVIKRILRGKLKLSIPIEILAGKIIQDHPEWVLKSGEEARKRLLEIIEEYQIEKGSLIDSG